jgi:hypothetical protein
LYYLNLKMTAVKDPYNWPALNRADLMSLNVIDKKRD